MPLTSDRPSIPTAARSTFFMICVRPPRDHHRAMRAPARVWWQHVRVRAARTFEDSAEKNSALFAVDDSVRRIIFTRPRLIFYSRPEAVAPFRPASFLHRVTFRRGGACGRRAEA